MRHFMAGFFLVFSFFKFLDAPGFASAFKMYDPLAKAIPGWSWIYPYVELLLGVAYMMSWQPLATNVTTLVLMSVGGVGVLQSLLQKRTIRCACLGTALNLPMTKVTLVENGTMAAMAAFMLAGCTSPMPNALLLRWGLKTQPHCRCRSWLWTATRIQTCQTWTCQTWGLRFKRI